MPDSGLPWVMTTPDGDPVEVRVSPEVAALLTEPEPELAEVCFTDLTNKSGSRSFRPESVSSSGIRSRPSQQGNPWEGPRFTFSVFLGEGRRWPIPKVGRRCGCCRGSKLESFEYCLVCDRSGMDRLIPKGGPKQVLKKLPKGKAKLRGGRS
jgi:hypothetical protein